MSHPALKGHCCRGFVWTGSWITVQKHECRNVIHCLDQTISYFRVKHFLMFCFNSGQIALVLIIGPSSEMDEDRKLPR